jgi:hypothetical protein
MSAPSDERGDALNAAERDVLVELVEELLDAGADTIAMSEGPPVGLRWTSHVDYLRALERKGHELLARTCCREDR